MLFLRALSLMPGFLNIIYNYNIIIVIVSCQVLLSGFDIYINHVIMLLVLIFLGRWSANPQTGGKWTV